MLWWWWGDNDNDINNPEIDKNHQSLIEKTSYISAIFALIVWIPYLPTYIESLSDNHQEKTKKEVVIPTRDTIHQILSDSIMNQENIDKEEWQQEGEQQGLSSQEIEESGQMKD